MTGQRGGARPVQLGQQLVGGPGTVHTLVRNGIMHDFASLILSCIVLSVLICLESFEWPTFSSVWSVLPVLPLSFLFCYL